MEKRIHIVAPHADDEVIGCFEILITHSITNVFFGSAKAIGEAKESAKYFGFVPKNVKLLGYDTKPGDIVLFPDPTTELHPLHRELGAYGEKLARIGRLRVLFYSTNMNAPYIRELERFEEKKGILNALYPEKSDLWRFDWKYFLFEGYTEWYQNAEILK